MLSLTPANLLKVALVCLCLVNDTFGQSSTVIAGTTYRTTSTCTTRYGRTSVPPKSTGFTTTRSYVSTATITTTPTVVVTARTSTTYIFAYRPTVTITNSFPPTTTATATATTTLTTTSTSTDASTTTETVTSTTTPAGSTIPAPAGFTPLASVPGYVAKKRSLNEERSPELRGKLLARAAPARVTITPNKNGGANFRPQLYPTSTRCRTVVQATYTRTVVATASPAITTTTTPIFRYTYYDTPTTVVNGPPKTVTRTVTASATSTVVTTISTSSTTTSTIYVEAPTPTVYAQCQSDNVISSANGGHPIQGISSDFDPQALSNTDAISCCVQCATTDGCVGTYFNSQSGSCYYFVKTDGVCDTSQNLLSFTTSPDNYSIILSDGQCGSYVDAGDYPSYSPA